jgi:tRNA threonylcarbamoyladenosine biosynthesis protein TsaE
MITCPETNASSQWVAETASAAETEALGRRIGEKLASGDLLLLTGTLGAGKTCLTRGLAAGWRAVEQPTSPTFTLINEYHRVCDALRFYHADCYRLRGEIDAVSTGIEDVLNSNDVLVIEWPERIRGLLPDSWLHVEIDATGDDARNFLFTACGDRAVELLQKLQE